MQKPFIKCVIRRGLVGFYIAEKNLLGVFKKTAVWWEGSYREKYILVCHPSFTITPQNPLSTNTLFH
jgi:hypothetical protein